MKKTIIVILAAIAVLAISFFGTAGLFAMCCWAFKWHFSWKIAIGVWAVLCLVSAAVKPSSKS